MTHAAMLTFCRPLAVAALAAAALALGAGPLGAQPVVLKGATPWIADYNLSKPLFVMQKMVTDKLKGKLVISYLGGEEVVPAFEQYEALRNGTLDVIVGVAAYYTGQIPEASAVLMSRKSPTELRKNGYYDIMRKLHEDKGIVYLANVGGSPGVGFRLYSKTKLDKPDLTGLKVRVSPVYVELVRALGGTPVNMKPTDVYTGLERGVVDAYGWAYLGVRDFGWQEVSKYVVNHPFYSLDTVILLNKRVWDGLPADVRTALEQIGVELEGAVEKMRAEENAKEDKTLKDVGMQFITWQPAEAKKFIDTAYDEKWKLMLQKCPEVCAKLRQLSE
jgi:TRAP-type C4-dicarboxylate transport system substrate-binding protein